MKILGIKLLKEDVADSYSALFNAMEKSKKGLASLGVNPGKMGAGGSLSKDGKNDSRRVEKRARITCTFGKTEADIRNHDPVNSVEMKALNCIYSRLKKDSIFRFTTRYKNSEAFIEFKVNDINPDAGFEPDFYEVSILKNSGFDPRIDSSYTSIYLKAIKDTKNQF
jgi:hypothetical protein